MSNSSRDHAPTTCAAPNGKVFAPVADQLTGDLLCPLCEEPLEINGLSDGFCARCMAHVEIV